ncbi:hypothetical protein QJS10_CPB04g01225 [Acorus calamus]|uniref:RING-type domain-containing protein n=1 Tax=Acorus calamus TaxID=4465 RepID=A0AAV9F2P2_ACOCL|nr:hypothetical protein QJS10_CPB04g01225 [Acorus calamus]
MEGRQNLTLSDRLSLASPSTTNPLKPRHGETRTLASILSIPTAADKIPGRTLLDIIRDESSSAAAPNRINRAAPPPAPEEDGRVSLMALLEQTDRRSPPSAAVEVEEAETETEEEGMYATCCVCMVRHKGAAFIPCGHTFCRLCSRELWVSRGNCPLCNGFILEILDIF